MFPVTASAAKDIVGIVDDDDAARDALQFLISTLGRHTRAFASPAAFLKDKLDDFACLLLDYHMPEMNGLELAQHLRSGDYMMPIMLVSGALTTDIRDRGHAIGIDVICEKPPQPGAIAAFLDRSLDTHTS